MTLKEEKLRLFKKAIYTYASKYGGKICPECNHGRLEIDPEIRYLMHYNVATDGNLSSGSADGDSVVMVFCRHCGYTKLLLADSEIVHRASTKDEAIGEKIRDSNFEK